jgi:putative transposase
MTRFTHDPLYRRHAFPAEVIAHAVWLYFRFPLSLRMVEDMLAARGVMVSHQTVRFWAEKFGRRFANDIRKQSAGWLGAKWHLDEVVITIGGRKHWLWAPSIRMVLFSTCWCKAAAMPRLQSA